MVRDHPVHCEDTNETFDEFQRSFPVGMWLDILTITDITAHGRELARRPRIAGKVASGKAASNKLGFERCR